MQHQALVSTRKGLFELTRENNVWSIGHAHFLGDPVTMTLFDHRDGSLYAALNLGHFGVKLHRRDAGSDQWAEIAVPIYPPQPEDRKDEPAWKLIMIWSLACGGTDQPGVLWAGTLPG
ncbi:MAG TPA: exo-alpha-sialidase, partial [Burkholderiaceae bacterium]|nr:exo-alpha-sialidase [Burkholderiaceae bacterium]